MKTAYEIYMDFRKAKAQADRLRSIAKNMNSLADEGVGGSLSSIRSNWTGENADAFLGKGEAIKNKISLTAADINKVADAIMKIAERTRDAELAAIAIAEE